MAPKTELSSSSSLSSKDELVEEFSRRFTQQAGAVHIAKDQDEVISIVNGLIEKAVGLSCCCAPLHLRMKDSDISQKIRTSIRFDDLQKQPRDLAGKLDVGITKADYAVAETGSIVDVSFSDEHRLLSSITRIHIAVLEVENVLPNLDILAQNIRHLLINENKPSITLIGGPSRTSDIELKQVLGVHGPHEVHVVILG